MKDRSGQAFKAVHKMLSTYFKYLIPAIFLIAFQSIILQHTAYAAPGEIFVYTEPDGSIRFTNRTPPSGVNAKVFTASKTGFSVYKIKNIKTYRLFKNAYNDIIRNAAFLNRVDPHLIKAVIHVESAFNSKAVSPKGALGLMQLMPGTAKLLGVRNAFMPEQNILGGSKLLAQLLEKYNNDLTLTLAAYNAGEGAVQKYKGIPPYNETRMYVKRVMELKNKYKVSTIG